MSLVICFAVYRALRVQLIEDLFTDTSLLSDAELIYQSGGSGFVGNDSYIKHIYSLDDSSVSQILETSPLLKECLKEGEICTENPSWVPRTSLVEENGSRLQLSEIKNHEEAKQAFESIIDSSSTLCAAHNLTSNPLSPPIYFNSNLVCVNSELNLMSLEYLSRHNSIPY